MRFSLRNLLAFVLVSALVAYAAQAYLRAARRSAALRHLEGLGFDVRPFAPRRDDDVGAANLLAVSLHCSGKLQTDKCQALADISDIGAIFLPGTAIDDKCRKLFGSPETLRVFWGFGLQPTNDNLCAIAECHRLDDLDLRNSDVGESLAEVIAKLTRLRRVGLNGTRVGDRVAAALAKLPELEEVDLSGTRVTDSGILELVGHRRLTRLALARTNVTRAAFAGAGAVEQEQWNDVVLPKRVWNEGGPDLFPPSRGWTRRDDRDNAVRLCRQCDRPLRANPFVAPPAP